MLFRAIFLSIRLQEQRAGVECTAGQHNTVAVLIGLEWGIKHRKQPKMQQLSLYLEL